MRCFIAVDIPKEIKDYLFELESKLASGRFAKVNWVHKKNLHVTLKFMGDVEEDKVDDIKAALRSIKFNKFKLKLSGLGFFPDERKPRVIWTGLEPALPLLELQQMVDSALLSQFPSEQRFQAHLTLGRIKFVKKRVEFMAHFKNFKVEGKEFEVESFELVKSELRREGPVYETIEEFKAAS